MNSEKFIESIKEVQQEIYQTAKEKGWWDTPREVGTIIALMHSELSEALEGARHGNPPSDKINSFSSIEEELADTIIRILDFAESENLDIGGAVVAKMEMNKGRSYKHGGKAF